MENATKALLISGSVLVVILLITIGIRILNSTKGTVDSTQTVMESTAKSMIINQFSPYVGKNKTAPEVRTLINKVMAYNSTCEEKSQQIVIRGPGYGYYTILYSKWQDILDNINDSKCYEVSLDFSITTYGNPSNPCLMGIKIEQK